MTNRCQYSVIGLLDKLYILTCPVYLLHLFYVLFVSAPRHELERAQATPNIDAQAVRARAFLFAQNRSKAGFSMPLATLQAAAALQQRLPRLS